MSNYTKSGIPIHPGLIQRDHLLNKMSSILNHPVTILSATAGCGKTALATQVVQQIDADVIWHTITQYEQDLRVFCLALLKDLEIIAPDILSLQVILQQPLESIVYEITTYLHDCLTQDILIVIDDWHLITTPEADDWLKLFIKTMPKKCHLMIVSRSVPDLHMTELIATRSLLNIPQQDLFFTRPEVHLLASQIVDERPSIEKIETVWEKLQGWPVGTILAFQPVTGILESYTAEDDATPSVSEALFQSISNEMLKQELPDIQHFLTWTSTGDYFNEQLCESVYNIADSTFLISEVVRRNLFVTQRSGGYQYHHLFRNFLQANFKLKQPDEYKSAHRRLAGWYQSQNKPDQAIHHYLLAGNVQDAVNLAEGIVYAYYAQGRVDTILQLEQKLKVHNLPMPNMDHILAQLYLAYRSDYPTALHYARQSLRHSEENGETYNKYDVTITLGMIHQLKGDHDLAEKLFQKVLAYDALPDSLKSNVLNQLGVLEYSRGNNQAAIPYLTQALAIVEQTSSLFHHAKLYHELELVYRKVGNVSEANDCLQKQIHYWQQLNNPEPLAMALNNLGYRYYEQGNYALAYQTYQQGLNTIANMQSTRARYYLQASLGDLQRDQGHYSEARKTYQQALNLIASREAYAQTEVLVNLSTLYRWQSKYEAALTCADNALKLAYDNTLQQWVVQAKIAQWHIRLQPWSLHDIQLEIQQALSEHPELASDPPVEFMTLKWHVAILSSSLTDIHSYLQRLTHRVNREQSIQPFAAEILNNKDLAAFWNSIKHQYPDLGQAIDRRNKVEERNRIVSFTPDTHSLHLYTLGVERIRKNNTPIKIAELSAELIREFLYYFIFVGGGTRDTISRIFWGDKPLDARKDNFHQTLSRIRSALGNKIIIYNDLTEIYQLNPDMQLWCDALLLESIIKEARRLSTGNPHSFHLWYQATQLTYGEFLPELDRDWISQKRHYFQQLSIDAWMGLADCYRQQNDYRSALSAYEQIATFAPHHEEAYRARMQCYSALGEIASIAIIYKTLEERLARDLQVKPSQQSHQLYKTLISSAS